MISEIFNEDCMIGMARYPDKYFDLAVVDPPYGIENEISIGGNKSSKSTVDFHNRYNSGSHWDKKPSYEYFKELLRVSKNQIICGGNYFPELWSEPVRGFIFWYKQTPVPNFSDGELIWTSFKKPAKIINHRYTNILDGNNKRERIEHPTAKPVALYSWIYKNYLPEGGKVIDTHLGSGSNRIAADKAGNIEFYGWEIDKDYFLASDKRFQDYKKQLKMF